MISGISLVLGLRTRKYDLHACAVCGAPIDAQVSHPLLKGYTEYDPKNIAQQGPPNRNPYVDPWALRHPPKRPHPRGRLLQVFGKLPLANHIPTRSFSRGRIDMRVLTGCIGGFDSLFYHQVIRQCSCRNLLGN